MAFIRRTGPSYRAIADFVVGLVGPGPRRMHLGRQASSGTLFIGMMGMMAQFLEVAIRFNGVGQVVVEDGTMTMHAELGILGAVVRMLVWYAQETTAYRLSAAQERGIHAWRALKALSGTPAAQIARTIRNALLLVCLRVQALLRMGGVAAGLNQWEFMQGTNTILNGTHALARHYRQRLDVQ